MYRSLLLMLACVTATARAQTPPTWHLQLDHAIRPAEGTEGVLGDVAYIAVTRTGIVYVAERKAPRVTRYDATGTFAGVVMRQGAGPAEVRDPQITLQGDTLVVYDQALTRLTRVSPSGKVLSDQLIDVHASGLPISTTRDGSIMLWYGYVRTGFTGSAVRIARSGHIDTIGWNQRFTDHQYINWTYPGGVVKGGPFSAAPDPAFDPAGRVVFGGSRQSQWYVVSGKDTVARVALPERPMTIPTAIRDSAWQAFMTRVASIRGAAGAFDKSQLPTVYPAWLTLDITPQGEWWIGRPGMDGKLASWDVVDGGRLVGHVSVPQPILQSLGASGRAFGSDLIALLHENEDGVPWIGVYRIVRGR